jgi:hypothetical protein
MIKENSDFIQIFLVFALLSFSRLPAAINEYQDPSEGCTIGVASGRATSDERPLLWKTRDAQAINNEVYFNMAFPIKFLSVISAGQTVYSWMGVNEYGFAIINSASSDLPSGSSGMGNGTLMAYALGTCRSVAEFQHLLDSTNVSGRQTQANFGVIDSTGAAAIYETAGYQYWKFDTCDTLQAPAGYVLRTNFAVNGGGNAGIERYRRTCDLMADFYAGDTLNYRSILRHQMRDFSDYSSAPFQIPYPGQLYPGIPFGYIYTDLSICRTSTVSTAVIHGVLSGEKASLTTLWVILGQPAGAIAVPYWPAGNTPSAANGPSTAPLCDVANLIRSLLFDWPGNPVYINTYRLLDGEDGGLWTYSFMAEDSIMSATDSILQDWRIKTPLVPDILAFENQCADYALNKLQEIYNILLPIEMQEKNLLPENVGLCQNYPNPFNPSTTIKFFLPNAGPVSLKVYNLLGEEVAALLSGHLATGKVSLLPGHYQYEWNATGLASGVYIYILQAGDFVQCRKMILLR